MQVEEETMAPARMMEFIDKHVADCIFCQTEVGLADEIEQIRAHVLPESKIPKSMRESKPESTPEISSDEEEGVFLDSDHDDEVL